MSNQLISELNSKPAIGDKDAIGFILRLGRALHAYGYSADRLETVLTRAAAQLGLISQFFSTPTSIFASFGLQEQQHTFLIRVEPGDVDLGKLTDLDRVTVGVLQGELTPAEGSTLIELIISAPGRYAPVLVLLAYGVASAAAARILGGGLKEILVACGLGLVIGLLSLAAGKSPALGRIFEPTAAFAASLLASGISFLIGPYSVSNATLAGLIVLVPGLTLTVAMSELSTRNLVSGTARLSGALVIFLAIGFGVALGTRIIGSTLGHPILTEPTRLPGWTEFPALALASLAFLILLRAQPRDMIWILLAGGAAVLGGRLGARGLGPELGVFVGALTVGIVSNLLARWRNQPAAVTLVPGILLLVPGSVGFRSLASLLDREVVSGVETAFRMTLMAVALVAGMLMANVIAPSRRTLG